MNLFVRSSHHHTIVALLLWSLIGRVAVVGEDDSSTVIIPLGNFRPEGIHTLPPEANQVMGLGDGDFVLVSELLWGSIAAYNVDSGEGISVVESLGPNTRAALGLWYDSGAIFAAGAGPILEDFAAEAKVYVYNATTGDELATCAPLGFGGFMNDVTVVDGKAYATDSLVNSIMVLDVAAALAGECQVEAIETPAEVFLSNGTFNANGIIGYADGLLIAQITTGGLYYLDLNTLDTTEVLPPGSAVFADGLAIASDEDGDGDVLYIAENSANRISVWALEEEGGMVMAEPLGYIVSDYYDAPATVDIVGDQIYAVNARFNTVPFPDPNEVDLAMFNETFDVIGVNRFDLSFLDEEDLGQGEDQIVEESEDEEGPEV